MKMKKITVFIAILLTLYFTGSNFIFAKQPPPTQTTNDFSYPIDPWQVYEESKFGTKRAEDTYHLGDDVLAPKGTPIKTMANGIVKHIGIHSRFGTVVLIEHELAETGEKFVSLYGHLRRKDIPVSQDQFVNKGEVIGYVGAAGKENGYWVEHLHFGIRWGEYVDVKTKWVYWGYSTKEDMANWRNPTEFIDGKGKMAIDPENLAKIIAVPANNGRAHIKMFDASGVKITNSDIYAARFSSYPGADVAVARTDATGGLARPNFATKNTALICSPTSPINASKPCSQEQSFGGRAIVVALGKHVRPYIKIYNKSDKTLITKFLAFPKKYKKGMRVTTGDINGDGIDEIIVASGGGIRPQFKIFDLQGNALRKVGVTELVQSNHSGVTELARSKTKQASSLPKTKASSLPKTKASSLPKTKASSPLKTKNTFPLDVAASDIDGDKIDEIIVGYGKGQKPYVKIFKSDGTLLKSFLAYNKNFKGGVRVSAADIDRDGIKEIITGAGPGGGPHVRIFEPEGRPRPINFFPFDMNFRGGVDVASADFNNDGKDEIIVSQGSTGEAWIKAYRYNAARTILTEFLAYEAGFEGGANIAGMK